MRPTEILTREDRLRKMRRLACRDKSKITTLVLGL